MVVGAALIAAWGRLPRAAGYTVAARLPLLALLSAGRIRQGSTHDHHRAGRRPVRAAHRPSAQ
ncbi:hypothetical protein [Nonomuraea dietziae]|uniref:hypothetical protein n=1 Tax=Nonomuraea dietziae TaxID=65515 RepID=UPI0031D23BBE